MKASILDLRRRMTDVLRALDRNEPVTILYRGRKRAILLPVKQLQDRAKSVKDHPSFGMWRDHDDTEEVSAYVRRIRKGRFYAS